MSVKYASECESYPDDCAIPRSADDECGYDCPHAMPKEEKLQCGTCKKEIFDGETVRVGDGVMYHPLCFPKEKEAIS